jgi:hypothetical protein
MNEQLEALVWSRMIWFEIYKEILGKPYLQNVDGRTDLQHNPPPKSLVTEKPQSRRNESSDVPVHAVKINKFRRRTEIRNEIWNMSWAELPSYSFI